jgi:heavy metal sensor kinase
MRSGGDVRLSIRWRLTLLNTLAVAVLLAGFAALVYVLLGLELDETNFAEADHVMGTLRVVFLMAVPVTLIAAGLVAYVLAGRALAPVAALEREAREITAVALHRRLPVANPHDELGRLTSTVNDMVGRLEHSFTEMRRFTADASHELRTPVTVIRTEAEVALDKPLSHEQVQHLLGSVLEECERLTRLTDQLLTLARQDAGLTPGRKERVDLSGLVGEVVETLRPLAEIKGLALTFNSGQQSAVVTGDVDQLRSVVINVLDNALKYTEIGSVTVAVDAKTNAVAVRVIDTGPGIAAEHLPHVFDRFYRADKARSRELGGSGLGLSIARGAAEANGGQIELSSELGRGTSCVVTLPRAE